MIAAASPVNCFFSILMKRLPQCLTRSLRRLWFVHRPMIFAVSSCLLTAGSSFVAAAEDGYVIVDHVVVIQDFQFVPVNLTISVGDTITWINNDIVPHTATAIDKSWDSGAIGVNEKVTVSVTRDMLLQYYCVYHPSMTADLHLTEEPPIQ